MEKTALYTLAEKVFAETSGNCFEGVTMFELPLLGIGSPDDALFEKYREEGVIGPWYIPPKTWLPSCASVAVFFFPFSEQVRRSNRAEKDRPSQEWLYGRIEGQQFLNGFMRGMLKALSDKGLEAVAPILDPRFAQMSHGTGIPGVRRDENTFGATWSDRHAAYVCGLGTFGISRNLLTEKGTAGRFASLLLSASIPADPRPYTGVYDYCTLCGACAARCPVGAIDMKKGKDVARCAAFLGETSRKFSPRYGCGLCQTCTPCETKLPVRRKQQ